VSGLAWGLRGLGHLPAHHRVQQGTFAAVRPTYKRKLGVLKELLLSWALPPLASSALLGCSHGRTGAAAGQAASETCLFGNT